MIQWTIYRHTSLKSGKSYIGLTRRSMELRWKEHCRDAEKGSFFHFHNAIRLYGITNWVHEVLVEGIDTLGEAEALEKFYIKKYDTFENGYNSTLGGEGTRYDDSVYAFYNKKLDKIETCTVAELATNYNLHQGYVRYVAQKKTAHTHGWFLWEGEDKVYDPYPVYRFEHKKYGIEELTLKDMTSKYNLSKGNLSMVVSGTRNSTKGWTIEGNQKVIDAAKIPENALKVVKIDIKTGVIVAEYPSIKHAASENNVTESVIGDRCRGRCSTNNINGYKFEYKEK